ncbi:conserved hypothetical protein [Gammaproteobacteria bacterium]
MERDWSLIRKLLEALATSASSYPMVAPEDFPGWEADRVSYHLQILGEAGLIEVKISEGLGGVPYCYGQRLTWKGQELWSLLGHPGLWETLRDRLERHDLPMSLEVLRLSSRRLIKQRLAE